MGRFLVRRPLVGSRGYRQVPFESFKHGWTRAFRVRNGAGTSRVSCFRELPKPQTCFPKRRYLLKVQEDIQRRLVPSDKANDAFTLLSFQRGAESMNVIPSTAKETTHRSGAVVHHMSCRKGSNYRLGERSQKILRDCFNLNNEARVPPQQ